jgi:rubrerythrin
MYSDKDLARVLRQNLNSEVDVIRFYIDNLHKLNYAKNRKQIDSLVLDSCRHATMISEMLLKLNKGTKSSLIASTQREAFREETGVKELYRYESVRTKSTDAKKMLLTLIKEEAGHERLVNSLR